MQDPNYCFFAFHCSYAKTSSMLSVASIRQQFSFTENILMLLYSVQFLKNIHQYLSMENGEPLDVGLAEEDLGQGKLHLWQELATTMTL